MNTNFNKFLLILSTFYFLLATQVYAGGVGTSTALFLQEMPSVRLQGMGGVSCGLSEDIVSIYTNPSGMGLFIPQELNFSLWPGFIPGSRYQFAGLFLPTRKLNLGISYLGYTAGEEEIVEFDLSTRKIKLEEDTVFTLSLGKRLDKTEPFFAGINLKYIYSRLAEDYPATSFTTDWAFLYIKNKIWFAVSIQNLFGKLKYKNIADPLPTTIRLGGTYQFQFKNDRFLFAFDLVKPNDDEWKKIIGVEYYPLEIPSIRLRGGIGKQKNMNIFGLGLGLKMGKFDLDYAYTGTGEKDNPIRTTLHRISFTMRFGRLSPDAEKRLAELKVAEEKLAEERLAKEKLAEQKRAEREIAKQKAAEEKLAQEKLMQEKIAQEKLAKKKLAEQKKAERELAKQKTKEKMRIAVADLTGQNVSAMEAATVADFLRTELINSEFFAVLERSNMEKILAEQKFQQTGCTERECAIEMGKILNVEKMVVGSFSKLLDVYYITARLVDVQTGLAELAESISCRTEEDLYNKVKELCQKIVLRSLKK